MSYAYNLCQATNDWILTELTVVLTCQEESGFLQLRFKGHRSYFEVHYNHEGVDTSVYRTTYNKLYVKEKDYVDLMCEDMIHILTNATVASLSFSVWYHGACRDNVEAADRVYEQISILSHKQQKGIPVFCLSLHTDVVYKLRDILQCFDQSTLTQLRITIWEEKQHTVFEFGDEIVTMDQWKSVKDIDFIFFYISIPFEHFSHCEKVIIEVLSISSDDIRKLIKIDFHAPEFRSFILKYQRLEVDVTEKLLDELIGKSQINSIGEQVRSMKSEREFFLCKKKKVIKIVHPDYWHSHRKTNCEEVLIAGNQLSNLSISHGSTEWHHNFVIMRKVTEYLNYKQLQALRKVSRGIRQCIDILKPDPKIVAVTIYYALGIRGVEIFGKDDSKLFLYNTNPAHYYILDTTNYSNDMFLILKNQKTALTELQLRYDKMNEHSCIECFEELVLPLDRLLSVENFLIRSTNPEILGQLLKYLDPVSLRKIEFGYLQVLSKEFKAQPWNKPALTIKQLFNVEHWKNVEELTIHYFVVECDVEFLVHFTKVDIILDSILLQNVVYLKDSFLSSPTFRQFKAKFVNSDIDESIFDEDFLGHPFRRVSDPSSGLPNIWFFPYTDVAEDLQVRYYEKRKQFMCTRIPREARF